MDWIEALDIVVSRTGHDSYRRYCADDHPERETWRRRMIEKAAGTSLATSPSVAYPPLLGQASNAVAAAARVVSAIAGGRPVRVPAAVAAERMSICVACDLWDAVQSRCRQCGCSGLKQELATEQCPLDPPKWGKWQEIETDARR